MGSTMTDKTEAQPEALYVAEQLDATRHAFGDDNAQSKRRASAELRRQHAEIQQLKAEKAEMAALNFENYEFQRKKADAATATVYRFHYAMKDAGWHPGRTDDDLTDIIRAKGRELAELSARQAAPDGWRLVPVEPTEEMLDAAHEGDREYTLRVFGDVMTVMQGPHDHYVAMLSAAPPPPEREPLTDEQINGLGTGPCWAEDGVDIFLFARAIERAHGIGGTND